MGRGRPKKNLPERIVETIKERKEVLIEEPKQENVVEALLESAPVQEPKIEEEPKVEEKPIIPVVVKKRTRRDIVVQNFKVGWTKILPANTEVVVVEERGDICIIKHNNITYHVASIYLA